MATNEKLAPHDTTGVNYAAPQQPDHNAITVASPPSYGQNTTENYSEKAELAHMEQERAAQQQQTQPQQQQQQHFSQQPGQQAPILMVTPLTNLGKQVASVDCPRCRAAVWTRTEKHSGTQAYTIGAVLCLLVSPCLAWIPCVIDDCKDTEHSCAQCNMPLATVSAGSTCRVSSAALQAERDNQQAMAGNVNGPQAVGAQTLQPQQHQEMGQYASPQPPKA